MHIISSSAGTAFIKEKTTPEDIQDLVDTYKPLADLLVAQKGNVTLDIILENTPKTLGTIQEGKAKTCDMITRLSSLLEANPECGKYIRAFTFQTQPGDRNCRISQKLMDQITSTGAKIFYAPPNMEVVTDDDQSTGIYTVNMGFDNTNSYSAPRFMADILSATAICEKNNIDLSTLLSSYTDQYGHGK